MAEMNPKAMIESYVDDVVRRLPIGQRSDVGYELRSLLGEQLDGEAADAGRAPDAAMAAGLLRRFGHPSDVAEQYGPAGFEIIRPSQAPRFALVALVSVVVQWALTLPAVFAAPEAFPGQWLTRLGGWWTTWGLGAFWLPGFLVVAAIIAGWARQRWPHQAIWKPRQTPDRDRVNRLGATLALTFWIAGAAVWIALPSVGPRLPGVMPRVFAFDETFLAWRAPWVVALWAASLGLYVVVIVEGRWRRLTRRISLALSAATCALCAWFVAAGPIFRAAPTDSSTKGALVLVVLGCLIVLAVRLYQDQGRIRPPKGLAPQA
jgi:hypothetical protein